VGPSKPPTKREAEWMDLITDFGCVACWLDGNNRFTLPLCDPGHHQNGQQFGMVSVHPWKRQFEAKYGTQLELLGRLQVELGVYDRVV
jgi:hypothetical protein